MNVTNRWQNILYLKIIVWLGKYTTAFSFLIPLPRITTVILIDDSNIKMFISSSYQTANEMTEQLVLYPQFKLIIKHTWCHQRNYLNISCFSIKN